MSDETPSPKGGLTWQDELRFRYGKKHSGNEMLLLIHHLMPLPIDRSDLGEKVQALGYTADDVSAYVSFLERRKQDTWEQFGRASTMAIERGDESFFSEVAECIGIIKSSAPTARDRAAYNAKLFANLHYSKNGEWPTKARVRKFVTGLWKKMRFDGVKMDSSFWRDVWKAAGLEHLPEARRGPKRKG